MAANPLDPTTPDSTVGGGTATNPLNGTDVDPHPPVLARLAGVVEPRRVAVALGAGAFAFVLLLGAGLVVVHRKIRT